MKKTEKGINEIRERSFIEKAKKFFSPYKNNKLSAIKGSMAAFLWGMNGVIHVLFLQQVTQLLENDNQEGFSSFIIIYGGYVVLYEVVNYSMKKWGWVELLPRSWKNLSKKYLKTYITLDNNAVELEGTGKLIAVIGGGMKQWGMSLWNTLETTIGLVLTFVFAFYMVVQISFWYSLLFLSLAVIGSGISVYFSNKLQKHRKERNENMNEIYKEHAKILMSKTEILGNNKISKELESISRLYDNDERINKVMSVHRQFMHRGVEFWIALLFVGSYIYLGDKYFQGEISLSTIVGFGGALILMQRALAEALSFYVHFMKDFVIIQKLWDFFDSTGEIEGYETGEDFTYKAGDIEIKEMIFGYSETLKIFDNFNLHIPGGKVTALVGNSGSGKTTLVKIISGYLRHDYGDVRIDGQKNKEISLKTLYKHIGYLTQEPSVFDGSIRENLLYGAGDKGVSEQKLKEAIILAKCEFIYDFEKGLDTEIGEKGIRLSGGQRQRLAIAKIFLKNPEIIILDEPTSALDSFSEEQITKAMHNLFKDRTVIIIAHRLQTVKNADNIFVLENGKVVEEGNHEVLLKQKGIYKKMLDLQSGF